MTPPMSPEKTRPTDGSSEMKNIEEISLNPNININADSNSTTSNNEKNANNNNTNNTTNSTSTHSTTSSSLKKQISTLEKSFGRRIKIHLYR